MNDYIDKGKAGSFDDGQEELFDLDPEPEESDEIDKAYRREQLQCLALGLLESACGVFLILVLFQAPISDYLMRRRMRKKAEYAWKLRQMYQLKYEKAGGSRWHGRN
jgi:hypothetical protein